MLSNSFSRRRGDFRLLIIDQYLPDPRKGAGYPRAFDLQKAVNRCGWDVDLFALKSGRIERARLQLGVFPSRVVSRSSSDIESYLFSKLNLYNAIIVSRPEVMKLVSPILTRLKHRRPLIIYDAEAIYAEREYRRRLLQGRCDEVRYNQEICEELSLANEANLVISVSQKDATIFRSAGKEAVVISLTSQQKYLPSGPMTRRDILFVGRLEGSPSMSPNVDSILWFVQKVMPVLDQIIGSCYNLIVVGVIRSAEIEALASERVILKGVLRDVSSHYASCRILVAPTRFAAGVPQKVIEAAGVGIPSVVTPLLLAQTGFADGNEVLTGETPEAFARACASLMTDDDLWSLIKENAYASFSARFSKAAFETSVRVLLEQVVKLVPS